MEALLGFIAGWALSWPALIAIIFLGIVFEANEAHGWAVTFGVIAAAIAYFFFSVPLMTLALYSAGYVVVGLFWSWWRYKRYADQMVEKYKGRSEQDRRHALQQLHPKNMIGKFTTWVLVWPFSMVENIAGDAIKLLQEVISKFFRGIYHRIYNNAVGALGVSDMTSK